MPASISFNSFPRDYDPNKSPWYRFYRLLQHLERSLPGVLTKECSWLDVGCHSGSFLRAVTEIYGISDVHGCDIYPEDDKTEKNMNAISSPITTIGNIINVT